ncbi:MAG: hypothetical protein JO241_07745, partial [Candidatus Eremiobacteraeota bacterium]|nr:hypothetical protein [Candidatus Eremiobacteraeota bacterium]
MINRFVGGVAALAMTASVFLSAAPASAQAYAAAPVAGPMAYAPVLAALEPAGCPLYGNGMWM